MELLRVHIENIRGIPSGASGLQIEFSEHDGKLPRWIVLAGRNGAGKSTVMRAIALTIAGPSVARLLAESFAGWIREGEQKATSTVQVKFSEDDQWSTTGRRPKFDPWVGLKWEAADGPEPTIERERTGGSWTPTRGPWSENPKGWFLAGYGPFRRLSSASSEALRLMMSPGRPTALASLFREDASLSESIQWLQTVYLHRLESRGDAENLERLVLGLLDDGLLPEGMKVEKINSQGLWVRTPEGLNFPLTELSDGYRTVAGLVLDIVKQIHSQHQSIPFETNNGGIQITQAGVVLIDEIDVHLHVEWQKRIGFWLKSHFPNIQFIVTTHSPFICQAADRGGLFRLSPPWEAGPAATQIEGEEYNRAVNGSADEALLTSLFGLDHIRSSAATEVRIRLAKLEAVAFERELTETERQEMSDLISQTSTSQSSDAIRALQARR